MAMLGLSFNLSAQTGTAQDPPIRLSNPDMEDLPRAGKANGYSVRRWYDCNKPGQTFVDIQPGFFTVETPPQKGQSYVGMVVRQDETWEGISQKLSKALMPGQCYTFSGHLAKSDTYISQSNATGKEENFANPVKLRIWGGSQYCTSRELLDESPLISHTEWKEYNFRFEPKTKHNYILLEVFYRTPTLFPYNGNILIDNFGDIVPIPCDEIEEVQEVKNPPIVNITNPLENGLETKKSNFIFTAEVGNVSRESQLTFFFNGQKHQVDFNVAQGQVSAALKLEDGPNRLKLIATTPDGSSQESRTVNYIAPVLSTNAPIKPKFEPKILTGLKERKALSEGSTVAINSLTFMADSSRIETVNYPILDELFRFMMVNEDISIELGGHTNNRCGDAFCVSLSAKRASAIMDYLVEKGIPNYRIKSKGYGKSKPIANNKTLVGRQRNQRVEVKILKMER